MIRIEGLGKSYGPIRALDDVDLRVRPGEVVLLLGANGAGKSTLFRCIMGVTAYEGSVRVDGLDPLRDGKAVRRRIGYMPQSDGLHHDLSVGETLAFYGALRGCPWDSGWALLREARLDRAVDLKVGELSGGMRQRLGFAVARLGDPPVLLLDEPTASLDGWSRDYFMERVEGLAEEGKTIMLSTHSEVELTRVARRAIRLQEGRAIADAPAARLSVLPGASP